MFVLVVVLLVLALFVVMLAAAEAGRRIGRARLARQSDGLAKGGGSADAATFALLIIDIEFPRVGLIRVDSADDLLLQVRASMQ